MAWVRFVCGFAPLYLAGKDLKAEEKGKKPEHQISTSESQTAFGGAVFWKGAFAVEQSRRSGGSPVQGEPTPKDA